MKRRKKTIELGRGGDWSLLSYPSLLLFFIALALLPLHTPKLSQTSFLRSPLDRASNSGRSLDNAKQKFVRGRTWWPHRSNAEDFYIVAQTRDTQGWRLSLGTTLTEPKLRLLAVKTFVWTEPKYWTKSRSGQSFHPVEDSSGNARVNDCVNVTLFALVKPV